jgi:hypothetical protein
MLKYLTKKRYINPRIHGRIVFLVRITDQIIVKLKKGKRLIKRCGLQPVHALDLGTVLLRQGVAVRVRAVG